MLFVDPSKIPSTIEKVAPFESRHITHAFFDIDGTCSLIREWVPVMALVTGFTAKYGLPDTNLPSEIAQIISTHNPDEFPEGFKFAIESAGLSALTQMEWALRCAAANDKIQLPKLEKKINKEIIQAIENGEELFEDKNEAKSLRDMLAEKSSLLFKAYEILLLSMCRNRNLALAKENPTKFLVPGIIEFMTFLRDCGVKSYFVTGAVVEPDGTGTMFEEIDALGLAPSPDGLAQKLIGSTWNEKIPKDKIMEKLAAQEGIDGKSLLVIGDGRSEVSAGVKLGALVISRLNQTDLRQREIHKKLNTNIIIDHYNMKELLTFMSNEN